MHRLWLFTNHKQRSFNESSMYFNLSSQFTYTHHVENSSSIMQQVQIKILLDSLCNNKNRNDYSFPKSHPLLLPLNPHLLHHHPNQNLPFPQHVS